jgi:hypothetical protein
MARKIMEQDINNVRKYCMNELAKKSWPRKRIDEYSKDKYGKIIFVQGVDQRFRGMFIDIKFFYIDFICLSATTSNITRRKYYLEKHQESQASGNTSY